MDCCRTSLRLGGESVHVVVRSPYKDMKASPWEIEDAQREGVEIHNNMPPKEFVVENGKLKGMLFEKVRAEYDENGRRRLVPTGEPDVFIEADDVIIAIGQDGRLSLDRARPRNRVRQMDLPIFDKVSFQSTNGKVFFGGDAAFGPENVITAVAQGHQAAISIDLFCKGEEVLKRPAPMTQLISQKMESTSDLRMSGRCLPILHAVPHAAVPKTLTDRRLEVELRI